MSFRPYNPDTDTQNDQGNDLEPPPDGTYTGCELVDAGAWNAKSGKDWAKMQWRNRNGHTWTVLQGFNSDAQTAVTWSEIGKLGINPVDIGSLEELNAKLLDQIGSYYDLAVKTNGQFKNTYVNGPTTGSNPVVQAQTGIAQDQKEPATIGAGGQDTEDIPF